MPLVLVMHYNAIVCPSGMDKGIDYSESILHRAVHGMPNFDPRTVTPRAENFSGRWRIEHRGRAARPDGQHLRFLGECRLRRFALGFS
jgi:hypothetical protein